MKKVKKNYFNQLLKRLKSHHRIVKFKLFHTIFPKGLSTTTTTTITRNIFLLFFCRWLAVRLETIGSLIIFFSALFGVISKAVGNPQANLVGLSVTYAMQVTQTLNWLVRMTSDVETNIVSVERIKEYGEIPHEAEWRNPNFIPDKNWPSKVSKTRHNILFKNYFRY